MDAKGLIGGILEKADVRINGDRPWDITVRDARFFDRILAQGSLGAGEAYMDGWWDAERLDETMARVLAAGAQGALRPSWRQFGVWFRAIFSNAQRRSRAVMVAEKHYDLGNDLFQAMLGPTMAYTCGYWKDADNLDAAQEAKMDLVCRKIGLRAGQRVLDIGCGWGSWASFAARRYGARVVGLTVSKEQAALARQRCEGLDVDIRLQDYRDADEPFDHVISIGMFEAVGHKNFRTYMEVARRCLKPDGLFLLHTIGGNESLVHADAWIDKHIFPNGLIPSVAQIGKSVERLFVMEDWHNFGAHYDKTLMAWWENFSRAWPSLRDHYGERFFRMWRYYILGCAGAFRARDLQLWQIVLSPQGVPGGYTAVR